MKMESIGNDKVGTQRFSLFRTHLPNGSERFVAKTSFESGEVVLVDHWNLATLQKRIRELGPVMEMARAIQTRP